MIENQTKFTKHGFFMNPKLTKSEEQRRGLY